MCRPPPPPPPRPAPARPPALCAASPPEPPARLAGAGEHQDLEPSRLPEPEQGVGHVLQVLPSVVVDVSLPPHLGTAAPGGPTGHLVPDVVHLLAPAAREQEEPRRRA